MLQVPFYDKMYAFRFAHWTELGAFIWAKSFRTQTSRFLNDIGMKSFWLICLKQSYLVTSELFVVWELQLIQLIIITFFFFYF